nr:hypothetical protein [uncultured Mediterranean phage uvMED]
MKDCTRLDITSANTISTEQHMKKVLGKKTKKVVSSVSPINSVAKLLGNDWKSIGKSAELSTTIGNSTATIRADRDLKTNKLSFTVRFNLENHSSKSANDITELKSNVGDCLLDIVRTSADLGNKLG